MSIFNNKEIINQAAQSMGIKYLDNDVIQLLQSDIESKVLEILQESKKIMRHSKRDFLKTTDIKFAMDKMNVQNQYGYPSSVPLVYEKETDSQNLWFVRTHNLDLKNIALNENIKAQLDLSYRKHFELIDGVQPQTLENIVQAENQINQIQQEEQKNIIKIQSQIQQELTEDQQKKIQEQQKKDLIARQRQQYELKIKKNEYNQMHLSKELDAAYNMFIEAYQNVEKAQINTYNESIDNQTFNTFNQKFEKILGNLQTEQSLTALYPHILQFVDEKIKNSQNELNQGDIQIQMLIVRIILSIVNNQFTEIEQYYDKIMPICLKILLQENYNQNTFNLQKIFNLKDQVTDLIFQILNTNKLKVIQCKDSIINFLIKFLLDQSQNPIIYYGSLKSLINFGPTITKQAIIEQMEVIIQNINIKINSNFGNQNELQILEKCKFLLLNACIELVIYMKKFEQTNIIELNQIMELSKKVFGDKFIQQLNQHEQDFINY